MRSLSRRAGYEDDVEAVRRLGEPVGSERKREQTASEYSSFRWSTVNIDREGASRSCGANQIHIDAEVSIAEEPLLRTRASRMRAARANGASARVASGASRGVEVGVENAFRVGSFASCRRNTESSKAG